MVYQNIGRSVAGTAAIREAEHGWAVSMLGERERENTGNMVTVHEWSTTTLRKLDGSFYFRGFLLKCNSTWELIDGRQDEKIFVWFAGRSCNYGVATHRGLSKDLCYRPRSMEVVEAKEASGISDAISFPCHLSQRFFLRAYIFTTGRPSSKLGTDNHKIVNLLR